MSISVSRSSVIENAETTRSTSPLVRALTRSLCGMPTSSTSRSRSWPKNRPGTSSENGAGHNRDRTPQRTVTSSEAVTFRPGRLVASPPVLLGQRNGTSAARNAAAVTTAITTLFVIWASGPLTITVPISSSVAGNGRKQQTYVRARTMPDSNARPRAASTMRARLPRHLSRHRPAIACLSRTGR